MNTRIKRQNDLNRLRRELKNDLFGIEFARASNNYAEISAILQNIQWRMKHVKNNRIGTITENIQTLIRQDNSKTPIFDETRLDALTHLLQQAVSDI